MFALNPQKIAKCQKKLILLSPASDSRGASRSSSRPAPASPAPWGRRGPPQKVDEIVRACHKLYLLYSLYNLTMIATKRVAVTESVWAELSDLKRPGETFSQLLEEMIEREKKARMIAHLKTIADEGDFVELPP